MIDASSWITEKFPIGSKKITLSEGFSVFPEELFKYKETLEILDLSKNNLSYLPDNFKEFKKLKIAFFSENNFVQFPSILAESPSLTMIGFKSNKIKTIPENSFPKDLQWLILTDNQIEVLPESIGDCSLLQKCTLAGNKISKLPETMQQCNNLELLRISANQLQEIPFWLVNLPKLSWLAIDGNPCSVKRDMSQESIEFIDFKEFDIQEKIGEGASGIIYKGIFKSTNEPVAIKIFKGDVTSDGYPIDELENCLLVGRHEHIVPLKGRFINHPEGKEGVVMDFIPTEFQTLGLPPSFATCTRDVFKEGQKLTSKQAIEIALSIAKGAAFLHHQGVMHGDLYAHNTLFHIESGVSYLGDFGASTHYDTSSSFATYFERLDVRAYGCLLDDLISLADNKENEIELLKTIRDLCWIDEVGKRISFKQIVKKIEG
jgi:hypothetical protein